jgi:hypothetical protein
MGGEFPNGATTGPTRPGPIEDSRADPERLPLNFEEVPSGASANLGAFHGPNPWFGPRSKCPAHETEPNKCTPQAWWRMHEKRRFASSLVGANRPIMHTSWGTHREGQRWGRAYCSLRGSADAWWLPGFGFRPPDGRVVEPTMATARAEQGRDSQDPPFPCMDARGRWRTDGAGLVVGSLVHECLRSTVLGPLSADREGGGPEGHTNAGSPPQAARSYSWIRPEGHTILQSGSSGNLVLMDVATE